MDYVFNREHSLAIPPDLHSAISGDDGHLDFSIDKATRSFKNWYSEPAPALPGWEGRAFLLSFPTALTPAALRTLNHFHDSPTPSTQDERSLKLLILLKIHQDVKEIQS